MDSEGKINCLSANAYFAILSQNPGWVEKCFHLLNVDLVEKWLNTGHRIIEN